MNLLIKLSPTEGCLLSVFLGGTILKNFIPGILILSWIPLLSLSIYFVNQFRKNHKIYWILFLSVSLLGWAAEWIGVNTGLLFGTYRYLENSGFKIQNVPIIIGLN